MNGSTYVQSVPPHRPRFCTLLSKLAAKVEKEVAESGVAEEEEEALVPGLQLAR